jgi:hypothetical protein
MRRARRRDQIPGEVSYALVRLVRSRGGMNACSDSGAPGDFFSSSL